MWHVKLRAVAAGVVMASAAAGGTGYLATVAAGPPGDGGPPAAAVANGKSADPGKPAAVAGAAGDRTQRLADALQAVRRAAAKSDRLVADATPAGPGLKPKLTEQEYEAASKKVAGELAEAKKRFDEVAAEGPIRYDGPIPADPDVRAELRRALIDKVFNLWQQSDKARQRRNSAGDSDAVRTAAALRFAELELAAFRTATDLPGGPRADEPANSLLARLRAGELAGLDKAEGKPPAAPAVGSDLAAEEARARVAVAKAEVVQAEVDVQRADAEVARNEKLRAQNVISQEEVQSARFNKATAAAKLDAARAKLQLAEAQGRAGQAPAPPVRVVPPAVVSPEVQRLREEKRKAAREALDLTQQLIRAESTALPPADEVYRLSRRVFEAEREADPSPANRVKAARDHLDRMKLLESQTTERVTGGLVRRVAAAEARFYRAEAELWVKEADALPAAAADFRGTVTAFNVRGTGSVEVILTPGADAGLRVGTVLRVQRTQGTTGQYLGTVTVQQVDPKSAAGLFTPAGRGGKLQVGDEVVAR